MIQPSGCVNVKAIVVVNNYSSKDDRSLVCTTRGDDSDPITVSATK